jgi:hypothetical protein
MAQRLLGLCIDCLNARLIESAKGSHFLLCKLSETNSTFPKYPQLPVLRCSGFARKPATSA